MKKKRVAVTWKGAPPTAAERRVIMNGIRNGTIQNGAVLKRASTREAAEAYRRFHWGNKAKKAVRTRLPDFNQLFELGKLVKVEYISKKGKEDAIWVHSFSKPYPSLTGTPGGRLGPIVGGRAHITERGIEK
jgi:hypothetical protein